MPSDARTPLPTVTTRIADPFVEIDIESVGTGSSSSSRSPISVISVGVEDLEVCPRVLADDQHHQPYTPPLRARHIKDDEMVQGVLRELAVLAQIVAT